jgi:putative FmdB family regulatory protein
MPLYEFQCTRCERRFEELLRNAEDLRGLKCPECGSEDVARQLSAASIGASASGTPAEGACQGPGSCCGGSCGMF